MVPVNERLFLRFKFYKKGNLSYVSHLDLVRTMNKIIVRAGFPLWYSEGFNPKPKMVFAAPLSVGTESVCEFMDVRLTDRIDPEDAMAAINRNMPPDMQVTECYYPEMKFTDLEWIDYEITVTSPHVGEELAARVSAVFDQSEIKIEKKTKSGLAEVDIRPMIGESSITFSGDVMKIFVRLSSNPSRFLSPELVVKALRSCAGLLTDENLMAESYTVLRTRALCADLGEFK